MSHWQQALQFGVISVLIVMGGGLGYVCGFIRASVKCRKLYTAQQVELIQRMQESQEVLRRLEVIKRWAANGANEKQMLWLRNKLFTEIPLNGSLLNFPDPPPEKA